MWRLETHQTCQTSIGGKSGSEEKGYFLAHIVATLRGAAVNPLCGVVLRT